MEHVHARRACRPRRSPTPGGRRSRPRSIRRPNPSVGDPICAGLPERRAVPCLFYVIADEDGQPRLRGHRRAARGRRPGGGGRRPARLTASPVTRRRGDRVAGRALAVAGAPPGCVRGGRASTGPTWPSTSPAGSCRRALDAMRTLGLAGLSVTTPLKAEVAAARRRAGARRPRRWLGQHGRRRGRRHARRPQHRRRRVRRRVGGRRRRPSSGRPCRRDRGRRARPAASSTRSAAPAPPTSSSSTARAASGRSAAAALAPVAPRRRPDRRRAGGHRRQRHVRRHAARTTCRLDPALLRAGQVVTDLVYHPLDTALLRAAASAGCTHVRRARHARPPGRLQQQLWPGHRPTRP